MKPKAQTERRHVCVHLIKRIRTQFNTNHNIMEKTCAISRIKMSESRLIHCVQKKKHPLAFSFISPCMMCRFKQKLQ